MISLATLQTMTVRLSALLLDAGRTVWPADALALAIRLALSEFSRYRPLEAVRALTLGDARELALTESNAPGFIRAVRVWYPYTAGDPGYPAQWVRFTTFWNDGVPT